MPTGGATEVQCGSGKGTGAWTEIKEGICVKRDLRAPSACRGGVHGSKSDITTTGWIVGERPDEGHAEVPPVAIEVVATFHFHVGGAEHRSVEVAAVGEGRRLGPRQEAALVRQGVPDDEVQDPPLPRARVVGLGDEEGAAAAAVEHEPPRELAAGGAAVVGVDGDEAGVERRVVMHGVDEAEDGGAVQLAVEAAEVPVGDDAAPAPADDGGAEKARDVVGRDAEQDVADDVVRQVLVRRHRWVRQRFWGIFWEESVGVGRRRNSEDETVSYARCCHCLR
jgi:hypothetical protein